MDRKNWLDFNIRGEVLRHPRKPVAREKCDTIVFDCTLKSAEDILSLVKKLKTPGRILLVVPSKDSPKEFPEEAGKTWDEVALREVISHVIKFSELKEKLYFKCYPEINDGYSYTYIALVKE